MVLAADGGWWSPVPLPRSGFYADRFNNDWIGNDKGSYVYRSGNNKPRPDPAPAPRPDLPHLYLVLWITDPQYLVPSI